jgi:hypothetical protein
MAMPQKFVLVHLTNSIPAQEHDVLFPAHYATKDVKAMVTEYAPQARLCNQENLTDNHTKSVYEVPGPVLPHRLISRLDTLDKQGRLEWIVKQ